MSSDGAKLVRAARVGDDAKVKRLLKAKVDVNYGVDGTEGCTGITALHEACVSLERKPHVPSALGQGLIDAARAGDIAPLKRLLKSKTLDVNYVNAEGHTALQAACCKNNTSAARARDAEAFKGGMTVKEINAAFGERAGELKKPAKRVGLIDMGLIHLFMM